MLEDAYDGGRDGYEYRDSEFVGESTIGVEGRDFSDGKATELVYDEE